nr:PR domain zinc finger protein 10-like [Leptinotarsa decemlineata]
MRSHESVGYSSAYAELYNLAVLKPKEERTWPCYECTLKFECSEELQNHLNIHDDDGDENIKPKRKLNRNKKRFFKRYQTETVECNVCQEVFFQYNYSFLKLHVIQKHGFTKGTVEDYFTVVLNFRCDVCATIFKSEALLKIHNLEHDPDSSDEQRNHVCPGCQRKYPTQRQLVLHVMQHALPKNVVQSERVKCPVCYKMFSQRERLQKHMLVHGSEESKPLQCKTCKKRFLNNSALACHIKTHFAGKKVFECPICKESFDHVLKLKSHVPIHCHNNTFTCPHCKKIFRKYSIIRKHIRAFHCERTHDCQHCSKVFPTVDKLRMHLLRHSDHREFLCADCGKQFKRKDKLKEHCKRVHSEERENTIPKLSNRNKIKKFTPKVEPTDFHRFIYKCHACLVGFKRRGMLVNHLAKRHPDIPPDSVPELNLPILQTTRDYYCQYCDKVYKSSSKRKAHILKNHPGAALPMSNRKQGSLQEVSGLPNPTFSQTVGSITTRPQNCKWCHKQYASKAKLLQHQRKKHPDQMSVEVGYQFKEEDLGDDGSAENDKNNIIKENAVTEFDKVVEDMMSNELDDYNLEEDSQYCHLSINENDTFIESSEMENTNSHLYRLLATNNGMLPPR